MLPKTTPTTKQTPQTYGVNIKFKNLTAVYNLIREIPMCLPVTVSQISITSNCWYTHLLFVDKANIWNFPLSKLMTRDSVIRKFTSYLMMWITFRGSDPKGAPWVWSQFCAPWLTSVYSKNTRKKIRTCHANIGCWLAGVYDNIGLDRR